MTIQGKSVYSGVAIGRLAIYRKSENQVKREKITDTAKEVKRFEDAKDTAKQQLAGLYDKALKEDKRPQTSGRKRDRPDQTTCSRS